MKSNEEYLDELLKAMGGDSTENSAITKLQDDTWEEAEFNVEEAAPMVSMPEDTGMGKMDQSMIDALLAAAGGTEEETKIEDEQVPIMVDQSEIDALLLAEAEESAKMEEIDDSSLDLIESKLEEFGLDNSIETESVSDEFDLTSIIETENMSEESSMLAQLMAEMEEESLAGDSNSFEDDSLLTEESIEALLSAAQSGGEDIYDEQPISFDIQDDSEMAEIEALLNLSENNQMMDENEALLSMLESVEKNDGIPFSEESEEAMEVDLEELDALLSPETSTDGTAGKKKGKEKKVKEKKVKEKKEKKDKEPFQLKGIFGKIFSALMEEIPEEGTSAEGDSLNLSDENKEILSQLDQEEDKKIKVKEKKAKKEDKAKKEKKPKKEKPKKEKKPPKEKKTKKEKKPKKEKEPYIPEKRIPRKKVIVTVIFAVSVMVLILLVEYLVPPMLTVARARSAYDKGEYYEAYKEYYGQKLSEEDEKRFQGATAIMRMQSNLDGYHNYLKMNNEVKALHSLLEGVHVKFDVFLKAEEFNVLSQVSVIYDEILEILNSKYHLTEEEAMNLIEEESDVVYTHRLEDIVERGEYTVDFSDMNQSDLLPEEELFFDSGE